jgi:thiol-disulfide isomerase/thioredoxin
MFKVWIRLMLGLIALVTAASTVCLASECGISVGSSENDWWIAYPDNNTDSGAEVQHPNWVLDALESKPVLIYGHKECSYCAPQEEAIEKLLKEYGEKIQYFDVWAEGNDPKVADMASYDPNGDPHYVPLTVILTLVTDGNGQVQVGWHSSEDITGEDWLRKYLSNALCQYQENSPNWNR